MYKLRAIRTAIASAAIAAPMAIFTNSHADETCTPRWDDPIGLPGAFNPPIPLYEQVIHKVAVAADLDGDGDALYVAGKFTHLGGVEVNGIAKWNPQTQTFSPLGQGLVLTSHFSTTSVHSIVTFDDGSGRAIYVSGTFEVPGVPGAKNIARWDGEEWSAVGQQEVYEVGDLIVFDDGTGAALYTVAWPAKGKYLAKWNPNAQEWSLLGQPIQSLGGHSDSLVLTTFDDGNGSALYAGGSFFVVDELTLTFGPIMGVARWDHVKQEWTPVGGGVSPTVYALAVYNDGSGDALYVAGDFYTACHSDQDCIAVNNIARWDGKEWTDVGGGLDGGSDDVRSLAVFDDGTGEALYAGGQFQMAGGQPANGFAKWDGEQWTPIPLVANQNLFSLTAFDNNGLHESRLYAGGGFYAVGKVPAFNLAGLTCRPTCPEAEHECGDVGETPGCVSFGCANQVARIDPTCCIEDWHASCAALAADLCETYQLDDGSTDWLFTVQIATHTIYINEFTSRAGAEALDEVLIDFWPDHAETWDTAELISDLPMTLYLWRDAVGEGNPADAVLIASQEIIAGPWMAAPVSIEIDPAYVGPAGSRFFIGLQLEMPSQFKVVSLDVSAPSSRSWIVASNTMIDPADIGATAFVIERLDNDSTFPVNGNFPIRANGFAFTPAPGDLDYDGSVNVSDLLLLLQAWGPCTMPTYCPADLTGDGTTGVADLLELLSGWNAGS